MTTGRYTRFADGNTYGVSHVTGPNNQNELEDVTAAAPRRERRSRVRLLTL